MYGFNPQNNIDRITQQIQELENIRNGYQNFAQQPIQNIINTNTTEFEAKYITDNDDPHNIFITRKTAFIDLKNGVLSIKELNGDITEYGLILPKDEKDLKIEELEKRLEEYEHRTNNEIHKSTTNDIKSNE